MDSLPEARPVRSSAAPEENMNGYLVCDRCKQTFPAKLLSVEYGDRLGVCLTCRPLFEQGKPEQQPTREEAMTNAELERLRYRPTRMTIIKKLQEYIRKPDGDGNEVETIPYSELDSPLAPYLREPTKIA